MYVKYETSLVNSSKDNGGKPLFYKRDPSNLDLWPHNNLRTCLYHDRSLCEILKLNSYQDNDQKASVHICNNNPCDLELYPSESKIIRGHGITSQHVDYNTL